MKIKYYVWTILIVAIISVFAFMYFRHSGETMTQFAAGGPMRGAIDSQGNSTKPNATSDQKPRLCPSPDILVKQDLNWATPDDKWQSYTPSSATRILSFTGAQWIGIKVGKIICLYETDEAVSFPVALEQTRSDLVIEPSGLGWSALTNGRKFCKSASVADCAYFLEQPQDVSDVYQEIKYAPKKDNS